MLAGLSLVLLAVAGGWLRNRVAKKAQVRRAATCPACGHKSGLRIDRKSGIARCGAAACGFDLLLTHCRSPRLRLTVLGPAGSGKTHWLSTAARELTAGHYLVRGSTTPSAATTTMEQIGGAILDETRPPAPTAAGSLPLPMVLRDRDPLGRSDLLVTVSESRLGREPSQCRWIHPDDRRHAAALGVPQVAGRTRGLPARSVITRSFLP